MKKYKPKGTCLTCDKRMSHRCCEYKQNRAYLSDSSWCKGFKEKEEEGKKEPWQLVKNAGQTLTDAQ
jgi:hypothetical protein